MTTSRYYKGPVSDHFDGHRFYGPDHTKPKTLWDILQWNFTSKRAGWPRHVPNPPADPIAVRITDGSIKVTMIGHACVLIQVAGINIVTDPFWSQRASPLAFIGPKRVRQPGIALKDLPPIDVLLISHNHYDHLDTPSLKKLVKRFNPLIITPLGNDTLIRKSIPKARVTALDWDQKTDVSGLQISAEPVQHWSARGLGDRNEALWAAFTITANNRRIFVTGDTGYGEGWWAQRAKEKHGEFDLALLPIGAYAPRWFMQDAHMNPEEAVQSFKLLGCRHALAYHHGTIQLTDESIDEPAQFLAQAIVKHGLDEEAFRVLEPGRAWKL